jgi:hypothetical protein
MRRGGFGALLAFTVAILMLNGQGGSSTGSAAGSRKSAALPPTRKPLPAAGESGSPLLEQGICKLQPPDYISCGSCDGFCPSDDLRGAIKAFFISTKAPGTQSEPDPYCELPSSSSPDRSAANQDMHAHWCVPEEFRANLKFVIAAVPDPAHTHLSVLTDRMLEATMEGAQASDYLFARSSLPWENQTFPESDDYLTRLNASGWQSEREKLPGLLIFRKATPNSRNEAEEVLFIFVVGERPTGGLNKQQFQSALRIMADVRKGKEDQTRDSPLLILGPNFSGSLYSLDYLLENDPVGSARRVVVHSGSVSSYETIRWFMSFPRTRTLDFRTFVESDDYQLAKFLAYAVCEQRYIPSDVVILDEDETAYGGNNLGPESDGSDATVGNSNPPAWPPAPPNIDCNSGTPFNVSEITSIFYPRDISHLRSAYQQQTQTAAASDAGRRPPRTNLPLNIEDTGNDDDSVPTYSPGQTPLSEESVLLGIVSSLHKQHAKFIILIATNPLDEIFLSQYLLHAYPEGRIVTFDEDLLLAREVDDPRFQGTLSVTSYPLFPASRNDVATSVPTDKSSVPPPLHEFPSDESVGTFDAMVSLLADPNASCDRTLDPSAQTSDTNVPPNKCKDLPAALGYAAIGYAEYGWPALGTTVPPKEDGQSILAPPLWLTVIGNDGYWPLAILDTQRYSEDHGAPDSVLHAIRGDSNPAQLIPAKYKPWELLCVVFIGLAVIYTYLRWTGSIFARTKISANFAPVDDSYCSYGLLIADTMLITVLLLLLSPWRYSPFPFGDEPPGKFLWVVFGVLVVSSVADQVRRRSNWLAALSFVFALALVRAINVPLDLGPESSRNLFFYRFVHITSGVSPLIPLLILALAGIWCAWYALAGLVLCDQRGPRLPDASEFKKKVPGSECASPAAIRFLHLSRDNNRVLLKVIHPANLNPRVILLPALAVVLSFVVLDRCHPVRSLESGHYNWVYFASFGIVLIILLCDLFRLVVVWIEFRAPLRALNRLPLRRGFASLEDLKGKPLWQFGGSAFDDFFPILGREIDALRNLKKFLKEDKDGLFDAIKKVEAAVHELTAMVPLPAQADKSKPRSTPWQNFKLFFNSMRQKVSSKLSALPLETEECAKTIEAEASYKDRRALWLRLRTLIALARRDPTAKVLPVLDKLHESLAHACAEALQFLIPRWSAETQPPDELPEPPEPTTEFRFKKTVLPQSTQIAEEFVCLFYYNFISSIFLRLRTLLASVAGMFVLLVLSFSSYPFEPKSAYHTLMTCVLILIIALVAMVIGQMHRDPTLSRITNTTPGELGWDFWFRMASFVALPLFTLIASQFPEIGGFLFFWAQPALNTFK